MVKMIYHGSSQIIEKPIYGQGKIYNDYGRGFYGTVLDTLDLNDPEYSSFAD